MDRLASSASKSVRHASRLHCRPCLESLEERCLLTFYGGYRTVEELIASINNVATSYPQIAEVIDYGNSYSKNVGGVTTPGGQTVAGYDLLALQITNKSIPGPKPVFFLLGGLHAREISTPEVVLKYVDYLTQNYGANPDVTWIVDHHNIVAAPVSNPDGHWYVERSSTNPWYWRKNGRPSSCTVWPGNNGGSYGVDLNRNFNWMWGGVGSSGNVCSDTYRGTSAASEPETQGIQNLVSALIPDQKGPNVNDPAPADTTGIFIDVHTYGGYVLWPWGHTSSPPPNSSGLTAIGNKLASYNGYTKGQSYQTLYATTATSDDWAYGVLGIPSYTIELDSNGFFPAFSSVTTLYDQVASSFMYAAKIARTPYLTALGPDALNVASQVNGSGVRVTASINDTQNGNQTISAAEFYIDTPPWQPGAVARSMQASDGTFNSTIESVRGRASTVGLSQGQHIVFVRGKDAQGNWGPFSASFFTVSSNAPGAGGDVRLLGTAPRGAKAPEPAAASSRLNEHDRVVINPQELTVIVEDMGMATSPPRVHHAESLKDALFELGTAIRDVFEPVV
jgi:hypothetical protein